MKVSVETLSEVFGTLMSHLAELGVDEIDVEHDYYWDVGRDELYDMTSTPTDLTIGQLSECMEHINRVVTSPDDALAYDLVSLAAVLRAVGYQVFV